MSRTRLNIVAVLLAMAPVAGLGSDNEPDGWLTLEDIFGGSAFHSTNPTSVMWLPDGGGFVFRDTRDGVNGLFRYDIGQGRAELVVDWSELIAGLAGRRPDWSKPAMDDVNTHPGRGSSSSVSPDGSVLLGMTAGDLYLLDLASGSARFLTDEAGLERFATFSPDGSRVAFTRSGDLFWVDLTTGAQRRLTDRAGDPQVLNGVADWVYEEELDVDRSFWWSPAGDRLLYVQYDTSNIEPFPITDEMGAVTTVEWQRYPKAGTANSIVRLGVVPTGGGATQWIPTGVGDGYIPRAGWMPGGREVWFQVLNRDQTRLELRAAVPGESSSRALVTDQAPDWVNVRDDLTFVGEGRFVWSSERDGWRHLYLYGEDGRLIRRLTRGEWQVEAVYGVDDVGANVVFQANAEDPRQRHIYSVPIDGGPVRRLVAEPGSHSGLLAPDGRHVLDTFSSFATPPRLELLGVDGRKLATVDDGTISALDDVELQTPELGTVTADNGESLFTWMFRPPDFDTGTRYPVLVYVYGGPGSQQVVNRWGGTRFLFMQYLARQGMVVFCLDNRGSWGRGHAFEAPIHRRLGEVELADQLAGVRHLKRQPWVDPDRIAIYGGSYGGTMVLLAMHRAAEDFRAGIAYAPVTDWRLYDTVYTERYMDHPEDNPDGYVASSPISHAAGLSGALLICHGTMDNNVHLQNTVMLMDRYIEADRQVELMLYPRTRHGVRIGNGRLHFHRLKLDFLERHLLQ
jgi:dipeptidyl-peptidase-4